ncbi:MAG: hypothetical protein ABIJ47_07840 [Candidatus Bathyarchaeota archaeon]
MPRHKRDRHQTHRLPVSVEEDGIHLIPVPDPRKAKASMHIPWSIEELEEAQEQHLLSRA